MSRAKRTASPNDKQVRREAVWRLLETHGAARFPGARGRIPNFAGAEVAARRLAELPEWRRATHLKCNPDLPQLPVRALALEQGKVVIMAVPRLREPRCFLVLDPRRLRAPARTAASIRGATTYGKPVEPRALPPIDLVVSGSVAVTRAGARLGKGGGYADLEFGLLAELGRVGEWTAVVTTVHPLQIVTGRLPMFAHDVPLDVIVTPEETIRCRRRRRPAGVDFAHLSREKIDAIPVLRALALVRRG